jgi:hypothetical protein
LRKEATEQCEFFPERELDLAGVIIASCRRLATLREHEGMRVFSACALLCFAIGLSHSCAWAQYEPFAVEVDPQEVSFIIDGPPGMYDVSVSSGYSEWSLLCQASSLVEVGKGWMIPASRMYTDGGFRDVLGDGDGLVTLDQPVLVAQGTFTGPEFVLVSVLGLSIKSEWEDRPGTYTGQITFTYLAVP